MVYAGLSVLHLHANTVRIRFDCSLAHFTFYIFCFLRFTSLAHREPHIHATAHTHAREQCHAHASYRTRHGSVPDSQSRFAFAHHPRARTHHRCPSVHVSHMCQVTFITVRQPPPPSNSGCHRLLTSSSPYSAAIGGATSVMSSPPAGLRCCIWRCACGGGGGGACAGTGSGRGVSVTGPRGTPMRGSGCGNGARREVVMAQRAF